MNITYGIFSRKVWFTADALAPVDYSLLTFYDNTINALLNWYFLVLKGDLVKNKQKVDFMF